MQDILYCVEGKQKISSNRRRWQSVLASSVPVFNTPHTIFAAHSQHTMHCQGWQLPCRTNTSAALYACKALNAYILQYAQGLQPGIWMHTVIEHAVCFITQAAAHVECSVLYNCYKHLMLPCCGMLLCTSQNDVFVLSQ